MEIQGVIIKCLPHRKGVSPRTGNTWEVAEYVLQTKEQFPKCVLFQVFGSDKIKNFNIQEGEDVKISFDINAREWNNRWFNTITAYQVEKAKDNMQQAPTQQQAASTAQPATSAPQSSASAQQQAAPEPDPLGGDTADDEDDPF